MDYLKIDGKEHPFLFSIKASNEMGKANLEEKDDLYFIFLGLKYGAIKEKGTFPYSEDALIDLFEDDFEAYEKGVRFARVAHGKAKEGQSKSDAGFDLDFADLLAFALVTLGLSRYDFEWMTPAEFSKCIDVYNKNKEQEIQERYEIERFNSWLNLSPNLKKDAMMIDIARFPWEPIKMGKIINGKTESISEAKPTT